MQALTTATTNSELVIRKHRCDSVWCFQCYKYRKVPLLYKRLNDRLDWKKTRQIVLTIDPSLFEDGQEAYLNVTLNKKIPQLIHNLKRTAGIAIRDYVWILEWHKNGFPHWHLFVEVEKSGAAGRIHFKNIKKYWDIGTVNESYFKNYSHWKALVGYFGKHGYFEKNKAHQAKLPEWAKKYTRTIKRTGSGQLQCHWKPEEIKKKEKEKKQMKEETKVYTEKEKIDFYHKQGFYPDEEEMEENSRKPYSIIIEACGKSSACVVYSYGRPQCGWSIPVPYNKLLLDYPDGQKIKGVGFVVAMDLLRFQSFYKKYLPKMMSS